MNLFSIFSKKEPVTEAKVVLTPKKLLTKEEITQAYNQATAKVKAEFLQKKVRDSFYEHLKGTEWEDTILALEKYPSNKYYNSREVSALTSEFPNVKFKRDLGARERAINIPTLKDVCEAIATELAKDYETL